MAGQTGSRTVDRTLKVLEIVATVHTPVSAKALARSLDCPLSTLYTLLAPSPSAGIWYARPAATPSATGYPH